MKATEKITITVNNWYKTYIFGALAPESPKFWLLFWGSVVAGCATYYTYTFYIHYYVRNSSIPDVGMVVIYVCVLLPFVVLRKLNVVGVLLLGSFLTQWLGISRLAFWLLILLYVTYRNRVRTQRPENQSFPE